MIMLYDAFLREERPVYGMFVNTVNGNAYAYLGEVPHEIKPIMRPNHQHNVLSKLKFSKREPLEDKTTAIVINAYSLANRTIGTYYPIKVRNEKVCTPDTIGKIAVVPSSKPVVNDNVPIPRQSHNLSLVLFDDELDAAGKLYRYLPY